MSENKAIRKVGMSEITDDIYDEVVELARLDPLSPGMAIQKQHLKNILEYFQVLSTVDVEEHDPTIQNNPVQLPLRRDEACEFLTREEALSNARMRTDEYIISPSVPGHEAGEKS